MLVVALVCVLIASRTTGDALHGAYRDSAQAGLRAAAAGFDTRAADSEGLRALIRSHPELQSASIHRPGRRDVSIGHPTSDAELLVAPIRSGGALALSYDMRPAQRLLDDRNRRVLITLRSAQPKIVPLGASGQLRKRA
jgi:hypothetical protein